MPPNILETMELKKLREKNDYGHYAHPKQLEKLRFGNFLNSVKLMLEKKKNKNQAKRWFELKDISELELSGNLFFGKHFKG